MLIFDTDSDEDYNTPIKSAAEMVKQNDEDDYNSDVDDDDKQLIEIKPRLTDRDGEGWLKESI